MITISLFYCCEEVFILIYIYGQLYVYPCIYGRLGKIQWNISSWKRRFLQSVKYGRYYWYRLRAHKKVFKDFEINKLGGYHYLYVQSDTLLLADVFEKFRNMCLKIYELDPACFLTAPDLAWQAVLKKTKGKLDLLTDIEMLLMVEKDIRRGICHSIYRYAKANNKYMKDYDKNKELSYLQYWDVNNLYGWEMLQKLPVNNFEWIIDTS